MTEEEFSNLLKKGNYTPEFRKFLENATIAWEESKRPQLKGKIKVKWTSDTTLQSYCDEFMFGTEEGFRNGGVAFKVNMEGATQEDLDCFEKYMKKWTTPPKKNFRWDKPMKGGKITIQLPDYGQEEKEILF